MPTPKTSRTVQLALASSVLALSACGGGNAGLLGNPQQDTAALQKVEETISRVTAPTGVAAHSDVEKYAKEYAASVDASINTQPQIVSKIEQIKTTGTASPSAKVAVPAEIKQPSIAPGEAKIETRATSPQVVLASHDGAAIPKAEPKAEPKAVPQAVAKPEPAVEPRVEPKASPRIEPKAEASVEPKVEPKVEPRIEAKVEPRLEPKAEPKLEAKVSAAPLEPKAEKPPAVAVALTETKVASAMGAMTVSGGTAVAEDPAVAAAVGEPAVAMDAIIAQLRKQVQANPRQLNVALALQLLEGNAGEGKTAPASALSETDQRLVSDISTAVAAAMQQPANATLAEKAAPLAAAIHKLEGDGDLQLPKLALASRVDSYGVYTPLDTKFENGKRHTVIIYCEVANFSTRKADDGFFTTKLAQQDSLITEDGLLVWRPNPEEVEDRSRNQRRDFYLVKKLTLPETLAIGKYTLRMSVTDKQTNKIAMVSIPVEIVAK